MEQDIVMCPYNKSHMVKSSRMQYHIIKCEKKYPKLEICYYNFSHRMPKTEMQKHLLICPSKPPQLKH